MLNMLLPQEKISATKPSSATSLMNMQLYISHAGQAQLVALQKVLAELAIVVKDGWEVEGGVKLVVDGFADGAQALTRQLHDISEQLGLDIACVDGKPTPSLAEKGVLFMDMDSTLIQCECIDEIADFLGIKDEISRITQQAMEGKLDFSESLLARVSLLKGLDESVLQQVYAERIRLTDGAEKLIQTVQQAGWKVGLVSGGFTYFTQLLQQRLKLDFVAANTLEIVGGKLTGQVLGDIVDANMKQKLLLSQCKAWGIDVANSMALGDGANDLPMLTTAGLGIAFHAKPKVRQLAPYALSHGGLDRALHLLVGKKET